MKSQEKNSVVSVNSN